MKTSPHRVRIAAILAIPTLILAVPSAGAKDLPALAKRDSITQQILGVWTIDVPKTLEAMRAGRAQKKRDGEPDVGADTVKAMGDTMLMEFTSAGAFKAHLPHKTQNSRFQVHDANEVTGEFTLEVKDGDDGDSPACRIQGDSLVMGLSGIPFHLKRLTEKEAKARFAKLRADRRAGEDEKPEALEK